MESGITVLSQGTSTDAGVLVLSLLADGIHRDECCFRDARPSELLAATDDSQFAERCWKVGSGG